MEESQVERETHKRTNKKWFVLVLLLMLVITGGTVFAYWAGAFTVTQAPDETPIIEIGEGDTIATTVTITPTLDTGKLVPQGFTGAGEVEELVYTFSVLWAGDGATGAIGALLVTNTLSSNPYDLLNINVNYNNEIIAGTPVTVTITITLDEPANKTEYNAVANLDFTLTVGFEVTPTP